MTWQEVCEDQRLADLPFKVELDQWGQIVMSPADYQHSLFQGEVLRWLNQLLPEGRAVPECAVETAEGTKVPDVVWISPERQKQMRGRASCPIAPEICIEILSPSNPQAKVLGTVDRPGKRELYFEAGAQEFWLCGEKGGLRFFNCHGEISESALCPDFPRNLSWFA
jgi:Uma2 family endonuclease